MNIAAGIHLPEDPDRRVFLQQSNYLDKELLTVDDLDPVERPIHQHWSWDRILRSCFIKQADVLQGLWVFEDDYDLDTIRRNFDFYDPITTGDSSLSSCVQAVVAAEVGYDELALEYFTRALYLDLCDSHGNTADGVHVASAGGVWAGTPERALGVAKKLRTGQVDINGGRFNVLAPFGGYKKSGIGREIGPLALEEFFQLKSIQR